MNSMAKSESSSRIVTSVVAVISAAALAVSLIAAGFAACAVPDVSTKALASAYSTDDASPFTKDELVAAAVQTKHYTIDDNDKAAVYATIAAVMGGGCFGDHCSPLSDTTILSSLGAGSDHVDHVKTQMPYALTVAVITCIGYIIIGICL